MPAARRDIDPMTGDYVLESGGPRNDSGRTSKVVFRLRKRRGTGLTKGGSRLYTITKNTGGALRLAEHYAHEAVEDLVALGEIRDVVATATTFLDNGTAALVVEVSFTDTDGDRRVAKYQRAFGGST